MPSASQGIATSSPALEISGLSAGYGRSLVLRDVNVTVAAGAVTALLGPNGAGKSTLLRAVCGFLPARAGQVRLFGEDVTAAPSHRRFARGVCLVPEGRGVFKSLTVRENLAMQAPGKGGEKEAIERAAEAFPILGERLRQTAGTLSGGQQQMLAMAAAYVRNPRLVLVDEPSLGLAPIIVDNIFTFLGRLAAEGGSLLIVDQFAHRVLDLASQAYVLRRGQVVFDGSAAQLGQDGVFRRYIGEEDLTDDEPER